MSAEIPPLRANLERCEACRGTGRKRSICCSACNGRGYFVNRMKPAREQLEAVRRKRVGARESLTITRRREDVVCQRCGSPNLETETMCAKCAEGRRAAIARIPFTLSRWIARCYYPR